MSERFKGWDWLELAEVWGIDTEKDEGEILEEMREFISEQIQLLFFNPKAQHASQDVREYLEKLQKFEGSNMHHVWKAMLKLDDYYLLKVTYELLPMMWC